MSDPCTFLGLNMSTVLSTAVGVIAGGLITWLAAWYYAEKSAKDMQRLIDKAATELKGTIPRDAAKQVVANNVVNSLRAGSPLIIKLLAKLAEASKTDQPKQSDGPPENP